MFNLLAADGLSPARSVTSLHIAFDLVFLAVLAFLLLAKKRYMTVLFGLAGGILYFLVDWGIFYLAMGARVIELDGAPMGEGGKFFFLLWMSMSYGFTNFAWIWLWLKRDRFLKEWSILICTGWIAVAFMAQGFSGSWTTGRIEIYRTTNQYHSFMALFVFLAYGGVVVYNLFQPREKRLPILWMLAIGILVQFGWEAALLISGVRPFTAPAEALMGLVQRSLIETNFGVPCIFVIQHFLSRRFSEDLSRPVKLPDSTAEAPLPEETAVLAAEE